MVMKALASRHPDLATSKVARLHAGRSFDAKTWEYFHLSTPIDTEEDSGHALERFRSAVLVMGASGTLALLAWLVARATFHP